MLVVIDADHGDHVTAAGADGCLGSQLDLVVVPFAHGHEPSNVCIGRRSDRFHDTLHVERVAAENRCQIRPLRFRPIRSAASPDFAGPVTTTKEWRRERAEPWLALPPSRSVLPIR